MLGQRHEALRPAVLVMQIIVAAMAMSVILFAVIVVTVLVKPANLQPNAETMTYATAVSAIATISLSLVLPRLIVSKARRKIAKGEWQAVPQATPAGQALAEMGDAGQLVMVYQTALMIGVALLEGTAFLGLVATMIEKSSLALAVSVVCLMLILARFPTVGRLENWLDVQRREMEADRMLSS